nr:uncharacterized protein LOC127304162 [Lolium perenne]
MPASPVAVGASAAPPMPVSPVADAAGGAPLVPARPAPASCPPLADTACPARARAHPRRRPGGRAPARRGRRGEASLRPRPVRARPASAPTVADAAGAVRARARRGELRPRPCPSVLAPVAASSAHDGVASGRRPFPRPCSVSAAATSGMDEKRGRL